LPNKNNILAVTCLSAGALVWGLIWFPYRALEHAGMGGALASLLTYGLALVPSLVLSRKAGVQLQCAPWRLAGIALAAGWCNLAYVLAMLGGNVMQVMLLFYLAPLWTVLFSRLMLGEKPGATGYGVVSLALAGACVMLWSPGMWLPVPRSGADWLGLSAGMAFALSNVLSRRIGHVRAELKSAAVCMGVVAMAVPVAIVTERPLHAIAGADPMTWLLAAIIAAVIFAVNLVVQHGLSQTPANRAIVIFLSELAVAALASHFLAFEAMSARQWLGGAMVVAAALCSGRMENPEQDSAHA
jgi:drug/metabolite transporter (DMT)-like permease